MRIVGNMCLGTVYVDFDGKREIVMQNVAVMEARDDGYLLTDLFGVKKFVNGIIKHIDLVDQHTVLLEKPANE
jgi:predicted RNA-binding protein